MISRIEMPINAHRYFESKLLFVFVCFMFVFIPSFDFEFFLWQSLLGCGRHDYDCDKIIEGVCVIVKYRECYIFIVRYS